MKIKNVSDSTYNFIINKDVDSEIYRVENEIRAWLYDNNTDEFGMTWGSTGFNSKCAKSGCDNETPKFWITEIKKINGEEFDTSVEN